MEEVELPVCVICQWGPSNQASTGPCLFMNIAIIIISIVIIIVTIVIIQWWALSLSLCASVCLEWVLFTLLIVLLKCSVHRKLWGNIQIEFLCSPLWQLGLLQGQLHILRWIFTSNVNHLSQTDQLNEKNSVLRIFSTASVQSRAISF